MAVKFPLEMADGTKVKTIEELRNHFDFTSVFTYYKDGRLVKWLKNGYYDEEARKVEALNLEADSWKTDICDILGIPYSERVLNLIDLDDISDRNERLILLKEYTSDNKILSAVDHVAFTQEELLELLAQGKTKIYLCDEKFALPKIDGIEYIGLNKPTVYIHGEFTTIDCEITQSQNAGIGCAGGYHTYTRLVDSWTKVKIYSTLYHAEVISGDIPISFWRTAAERGNAVAELELADCYYTGNGVQEDEIEAHKWYQRAAEHGNSAAQFIISLFHYEAREYAKSLEYILLAAEHGEVRAQLYLGSCYAEGDGVEKNYEKAIEWFSKAAEQGNAEAQYKLAQYYSNGIGVEKSLETAFKWYQKAAEQNHIEAQYALGCCYDDGYGTTKNFESAVFWWKKSAEQGDVEAQYKLGDRLYRRLTIASSPEEHTEAWKWLLLSAEHGNADAEYQVGLHYRGKDDDKAILWLNRAIAHGNHEASISLDVIYERRTREAMGLKEHVPSISSVFDVQLSSEKNEEVTWDDVKESWRDLKASFKSLRNLFK